MARRRRMGWGKRWSDYTIETNRKKRDLLIDAVISEERNGTYGKGVCRGTGIKARGSSRDDR